MSGRGYVVLSLLGCCLILPVIIIGASCPPPSNPAFISLQTSPSALTLNLPPCDPGFVCISIVNQSCVDVDTILYVHDGFDLEGEYVTRTAFECCEDANSDTPCRCYRPGFDTGEMQLVRPELFQADLRREIEGEMTFTLEPDQGVLEPIQCGDIKTIGLEVAQAGNLPGSPEFIQGPDYRCAEAPATATGVTWEMLEEDVACGATIQYTIYDRNDCVAVELTVLRVDMDVSRDCSDIEVGDEEEEGEGDGTGAFGG